MSFIMIAAGPTSCSRMRTVSIRTLLLAGGVCGLALLAAGAGLGRWLAAPVAPAVAPVIAAAHDAARAPSVFAAEQLGALSGRLFKLESQASQLLERIGTLQGGPAADKTSPRAARKAPAGAGGPMLPPRPELSTLDDASALESRLAGLEQQLALAADAAALQNLVLMRLPTRLPIDADVVSSFGNREDPFTGRHAFHAGLDFAAEKGTAIHAAAGGTVAFAGFRPDFGWVVEVDHGNGLATRYAHASKLLVKAGAVVMPGDTIAAVGSTGRSTGAHLHFEVLRNGEATDPRRYLAGL
jgi:murein DD-endopeptidase MepM/ murein hydrolase activator NlpD